MHCYLSGAFGGVTMARKSPGERGIPQLTTSHWPADTSVPLLETTVGSVLRDAAELAPTAGPLSTGTRNRVTGLESARGE